MSRRVDEGNAFAHLDPSLKPQPHAKSTDVGNLKTAGGELPKSGFVQLGGKKVVLLVLFLLFFTALAFTLMILSSPRGQPSTRSLMGGVRAQSTVPSSSLVGDSRELPSCHHPFLPALGEG